METLDSEWSVDWELKHSVFNYSLNAWQQVLGSRPTNAVCIIKCRQSSQYVILSFQSSSDEDKHCLDLQEQWLYRNLRCTPTSTTVSVVSTEPVSRFCSSGPDYKVFENVTRLQESMTTEQFDFHYACA